MERMQLHHHKLVLTLTTVFMVIIGVVIAIQIAAAAPDSDALSIINFAYLLLLVVLMFIMTSVLLRTRDELHAIHEELRTHITNSMKTIHAVVQKKQVRPAKSKKR